MKDEAALAARNLAAGYDVPVAENITLSVMPGEILTLIGPNGSGKSTILKTLAGALKKHGGAVYINGRDADKIPTKERAKLLSVMLTERVVPELMTCREVVETGRYPYTGYFGALGAEDKRAVDEAIELTAVSDFADAQFSEVSDGQRQRALLAKAICQRAQILILDEPTSYLDIRHKIAFLEILRRLAREKRIAVIMSMHETDFAERISDYVICVKNGGIFCEGKPDEIFTDDVMTRLFDVSPEMYSRYFN